MSGILEQEEFSFDLRLVRLEKDDAIKCGSVREQ